MNDFMKRVHAIKELYPEVVCNNENQGLDENGNEVSMDETAITNKIAEMDIAREQAETNAQSKKASAKQKLQDLGLTAEEIKETFGL